MDADFNSMSRRELQALCKKRGLRLPANSKTSVLVERLTALVQGLKKKLVKEGEGYETPEVGDEVEEQIIDGLDLALTTMKKGEIAPLTIPPEHAFGSVESKQDLAVVPPDSTVVYEVELVSFVKERESWDMNNTEKVEAAGKKKEEGNALFKLGKYARASKKYEKGAKFIEYESSFSEEESNLNAACKLKLKDYRQAEKLCTKVLEIESRNVKALYRRAQAYIQLADLDLAELDIKKALEIDPNNRDVKMEYKLLKEKVKEFNKKEAKFYGNMFAKMSKLEHPDAKKAGGDAKQDAEPMSVDGATA